MKERKMHDMENDRKCTSRKMIEKSHPENDRMENAHMENDRKIGFSLCPRLYLKFQNNKHVT